MNRKSVSHTCVAVALAPALIIVSGGWAKTIGADTVTSSPPTTMPPKLSTDPYKAAMAYAACMRAHGVPHPNPDRTGNFQLTEAQEARLAAAGRKKVELASRVCFKYLRPVVSTKPLSPEAKARALVVLRDLRTCVKKRGFTLGTPVVRNTTLGRAFFGFQQNGSPPSKAMTRVNHICERQVHLAARIDAIVAADRAPI
jgi:hypothetical protein